MLIVDAGPLVAAAVRGDRNRGRCSRLSLEATGPLVVPALVITEVAYLLAARHGGSAERAFVGSCATGGLYVEPVEPSDWALIGELLDHNADLGLGTVDASVLVACERLGAAALATLDHRHYSVGKPRHRESLTLLPG